MWERGKREESKGEMKKLVKTTPSSNNIQLEMNIFPIHTAHTCNNDVGTHLHVRQVLVLLPQNDSIRLLWWTPCDVNRV